jgi:hypothetical protein
MVLAESVGNERGQTAEALVPAALRQNASQIVPLHWEGKQANPEEKRGSREINW